MNHEYKIESGVNEMRRLSANKRWQEKVERRKKQGTFIAARARFLEEYVAWALRQAAQQGAPIKDAWATKPFSEDDRNGCDVMIIGLDDSLHPLQVKSSPVGARQFRKEQRRRNKPVVPVIVPQLDNTLQQIIDKIGEEMPLLRGFKLEKGEIE